MTILQLYTPVLSGLLNCALNYQAIAKYLTQISLKQDNTLYLIIFKKKLIIKNIIIYANFFGDFKNFAD